LRWEHVDLATGVIHVEAGWDREEREEIDPKTEDGRRKVPVAGVLRDLPLDHRMEGAGDGYVFGRTSPPPKCRGERIRRSPSTRATARGSVRIASGRRASSAC
jgi:hypothetical protein